MLRRFAAEFLGTCTLVAVVVGSGTMATSMSADRGVELLINTLSTVLALGILIQVLGPISGAHFNPVVTLSDLAQQRVGVIPALGYLIAQFSGALAGVALANLMFKNPAYFQSHHIRQGGNLFLGEVVATAGLLFLIQMLSSQEKLHLAPVMVAAWIGSAYFFTSSTSFANPAVTLARGFTDTFSGIALRSIAGFMLAQCIGASIGVSIALLINKGESHEQ